MNDLNQAYYGAFIAGVAIMCAGAILLYIAWSAHDAYQQMQQNSKERDSMDEWNDK